MYNGGYITIRWGRANRRGFRNATVKIQRGGCQEVQDWLSIHADDYRRVANAAQCPEDFAKMYLVDE